MKHYVKYIVFTFVFFFLFTTNVFALDTKYSAFARGVYSDGTTIYKSNTYTTYDIAPNTNTWQASSQDPFVLGAEYVVPYEIAPNTNSITGTAYIPVCVTNGVDPVYFYNRPTQNDVKLGFNSTWFTYNQNVTINRFEVDTSASYGITNTYNVIFYCTGYKVDFTINNNSISGGTNFSFGIVPSSAGQLVYQPANTHYISQSFPVRYWNAETYPNLTAKVEFISSTQTDPTIDGIKETTEDIKDNTNTIISQNEDINDNLSDINSNLTDESSLSDSEISTFLENIPLISFGPLSTLLQLPIRLINDTINLFGSNVCTAPLTLGSLYGTNLTLPCINLRDYLGNDLYNTIDLIFAVFILYNTFMLVVHFIESWTSLRDETDSLYTPKHADSGYRPRHGGGN